ncbi:MAG: hypothetical protein AABW81_01250 [Nanoarchaeota archaeon]
MVKTPYTDKYKKNMRNHFERKWENKDEKEIEEKINSVEKEIKKEYREARDFINEPKHIKILKIIALIIPLIIVGYLIYNNFLISHEFNYFYDIGSDTDAKKSYLSPFSRISEPYNTENTTYREAKQSLVYFNIPIPRESRDIKITSRIKVSENDDIKILLGAKDQESWHYLWKPVYNPNLNGLSEFQRKGSVYLVNTNLPALEFDELLEEESIIIATDGSFKPVEKIIEDYSQEETIIDTSLRGRHTFYIYAEGDLNIDVKKQDINWYNGSDELDISLYDSLENIVVNTGIPDDGIESVNRETANIQSGHLRAINLPEGVYKLEFSEFDGLIREIRLNTNKIVTNRLFLAGNIIYNGIETKESIIYVKANRKSQMELKTWHNHGLQTVKYNDNSFNLDKIQQPSYLKLDIGEYYLEFPENDIIISSPFYMSFSKENYFEPFKQTVISLTNNLTYLKNNVDYLVVNYNSPSIRDGDWIITEANFNIEEDNLFIKDNQLSMVFNIPHLNQDDMNNYTVPIDWINITVYKPGLSERRK